jgi:hypothetical protein
MKYIRKFNESYYNEIDINILKKYNIIGLDFDETLINNPNSEKIINFVKQNPNKTYYIVTFRSHGYQNYIPQILWNEYRLKFPKDKILNIPNEIFNLESIGAELVDYGYENFGEYLRQEYRKWKGDTCLKYNIEILIDDDYDNVFPQLIKNGIDYLDPYEIK